MSVTYAAVTFHELFKLAAVDALEVIEENTWRRVYRAVFADEVGSKVAPEAAAARLVADGADPVIANRICNSLFKSRTFKDPENFLKIAKLSESATGLYSVRSSDRVITHEVPAILGDAEPSHAGKVGENLYRSSEVRGEPRSAVVMKVDGREIAPLPPKGYEWSEVEGLGFNTPKPDIPKDVHPESEIPSIISDAEPSHAGKPGENLYRSSEVRGEPRTAVVMKVDSSEIAPSPLPPKGYEWSEVEGLGFNTPKPDIPKDVHPESDIPQQSASEEQLQA
jgi:hypothetical protein